MIKKIGEVVCPFYCSDDGRMRIVCEGVADDSHFVQQFGHKAAYRKQMQLFCAGNCTCCEVFRMIVAAKYDE